MEALKAAAAGSLSHKGDLRIRQTAILMIFIVGIASGLLSWSGLTFLGTQAGFGGISWLLPVSIDGALILGSCLVLHNSLTNEPVWFGWLLTATGSLLSVWGNIASVGAHDLQSQLVHGIPPTMLFLSVEGLVRIVKNRISVTQELQAQAEREAIKEAKRLERLAEQEKISGAVKTKDSKVLLAQTKRGGTKVSLEDPEVETYKAVLVSLDAGVSKMAKVTAILTAHPQARTTHMALAMDVDSRSLGTTVMRAKAKLLSKDSPESVASHESVSATDGVASTDGTESDENTEQKDTFQEIVKSF
jgi:hypothetical protein